MDNMAYLQQISGVNNSLNSKAKKKGPLSKILNVWVFVGIGLFIALIVGVSVLVATLNKVDTKDQDLMTQSFWMANYLIDDTFTGYTDLVKDSGIRNMSASLKSVLSEIKLGYKTIMEEEYGINVENLSKEEDPIVVGEGEHNDELNTKLENARLNGILDRVYLREITMEIAYLRSYQSEIVERTSNENVKAFALKAEGNLKDLYDQFYDYKSLTI